MLFKSIILTLAALIAANSGEDGKVDAGCKPCRPCPLRCPDATALEAATYLVNNICTIINTKDLTAAQTLVNAKTTGQFILLNNFEECSDTGVQPILNILIPTLWLLGCPNFPNIVESYVDQKGRVIVFTESTITVGESYANVNARYTFEPVDASCEYQLIDLLLRQVECIPGYVPPGL